MTDIPSAVQRRRTPAYAFAGGAAVIMIIALLAYLFWGGRAETPTTPAEAVQTDEINMPAPDAAAVRAQVDAALKAAPDPTNQPAAEAVREAEAHAAQAEAAADAPARSSLPPGDPNAQP